MSSRNVVRLSERSCLATLMSGIHFAVGTAPSWDGSRTLSETNPEKPRGKSYYIPGRHEWKTDLEDAALRVF